jgi:NDP-sugar pyrophosphorylase family protein
MGRNEIVEVSADGGIARIHRDNGIIQESRFFPVGVYCFQPSTFQFYKKGESFLDIKEQLLPRMLENGKHVAAHQLAGGWQYLFNLEDYMRMNEEVLTGRLGNLSYRQQISPDVWVGQNVRIGNRVNFIPPVWSHKAIITQRRCYNQPSIYFKN